MTTRDKFELALRFVRWAGALGRVPTAADVQAEFGVSRAAAYRMRASYCEVMGIASDQSRAARAQQDALT